jgi:hypothetical protein
MLRKKQIKSRSEQVETACLFKVNKLLRGIAFENFNAVLTL